MTCAPEYERTAQRHVYRIIKNVFKISLNLKVESFILNVYDEQNNCQETFRLIHQFFLCPEIVLQKHIEPNNSIIDLFSSCCIVVRTMISAYKNIV